MMTRDQFIAHWLSPDSEGMSALAYLHESLAEKRAQYASEVALYGDAGPGQGLDIRRMEYELANVTRQLERLMGVPPFTVKVKDLPKDLPKEVLGAGPMSLYEHCKRESGLPDGPQLTAYINRWYGHG